MALFDRTVFLVLETVLYAREVIRSIPRHNIPQRRVLKFIVCTGCFVHMSHDLGLCMHIKIGVRFIAVLGCTPTQLVPYRAVQTK